MAVADDAIILVYLVLVVSAGLWCGRRTSRDLDAYFLGGKRIHWIALAMSGSVSNFDITGTMWIVSILFVLGMKSMWHHWMWGVLMGAFFMSYMGKWVRRSRVMTAAEWMATRFGTGSGGRLARTTYALMAILTLASFVGYAYQGIGKFASVYIPLESLADRTSLPWLQNLLLNHATDILAIAIFALTTLYIIKGGFSSVIITDVFQTVVLTLGSIFIAVIAWMRISSTGRGALPKGFTSLSVPWRIPDLAGGDHAQFEFFGALVIIWVVKGLLLNAGGPGQMYDFQRFLAARNARDAAKVGAAWSSFLMVRWAMAMGIVLLAFSGGLDVRDTEKVMPQVLRQCLPAGVRGLVIAGLLAAFMSTFSSTVNCGAAFITRDLWQVYVRPKAGERQLSRVSYLANLGVVLLGIGIGFMGDTIASIWKWMMMALGAGMVVPNVLRWYWWRLNGWGYAAGTLSGMLLALIVLFLPGTPDYVVFPLIIGASFTASVVLSWMTQPVSRDVITRFYISVRPFGWWRPVRDSVALTDGGRAGKSESAGLTLLNVVLAMIAISGLYLFPMYLVGHCYLETAVWLGLAVTAMAVLKFTWHDTLPLDTEEMRE